MANRLWDSKREALRKVLKGLRIQREITQAELSARLGKPQSYVSKYESGERKLDFVEVLDVADALSVPPESLLADYVKAVAQQ